MTEWSDGKRTFSRSDIEAMLFDDGVCAEMFEEEFNEDYTPIEVVYRYGGVEGYDSEFFDWLSALSDSEVTDVLARVGHGHIRPVGPGRASSSCRSKTAPKSASKRKAPAKKPSAKRRC